jgi:hypothetical protein
MERLGIADDWDSLQSKPESRLDLQSWQRDKRGMSKETVEDFPGHLRSMRLSQRPERRSARVARKVSRAGKGRLVKKMGNWAEELRWRVGRVVRDACR